MWYGVSSAQVKQTLSQRGNVLAEYLLLMTVLKDAKILAQIFEVMWAIILSQHASHFSL